MVSNGRSRYYRGNSCAHKIYYYLATIIIVTKLILAYSEIIVVPSIVNGIFNYAFILLMLVKVLTTFNFKLRKVYMFFILFAGMAFYTSVQIQDYIILYSALGIIAIKGMNINAVIRVSYRVKVFWLSLHFICFIIAMLIIPKMVEYSYIDGEIRYRIFLSQPNTCAMLFLWAIFEHIYLNYDRLSFKKFLGCTFISGLVVYITKSKTSIIVYMSLWLLIWLKQKKVVQRFISLFSKYGYVILSVFFVSTTIIYTRSPFVQKMNVLLTGRLAGAAKAYSMYGFTMFGQYLELGKKMEWDAIYGVTSIWLENTYSMMFINYGIVYAILIAAALWYASEYLTEKDKIFVCIMLLYGIGESYIVDIFLCFPLLVVATAIYNKHVYLLKNYRIANTKSDISTDEYKNLD